MKNVIPVLKISGVSSENPHLPTLLGVDMSKPMGVVKIDFGRISTDYFNKIDVNGSSYDGSASSYFINSTQLFGADGKKSRAYISSSSGFFTSKSDNVVVGNDVLKDYIFIATPENHPYGSYSGSIYIENLDPLKKYKISINAARITDSGINCVADYSVNGSSQVVDAKNNYSEVVWDSVYPDSSGRIELKIDKGTVSGYAYINAMTIEEL